MNNIANSILLQFKSSVLTKPIVTWNILLENYSLRRLLPLSNNQTAIKKP